jgi:hypothetical protein
MPLMVGLWDPDSDLQKPRQRLEAAGAGYLVVSFADCVEVLDALATAAVAKRAAASPGRSPALQT